MNNFKGQWPKLDWDFFKEFAKLHNEVCMKKRTQQEFSEFVIRNKEKFNNPDYLQVFSENIELFNEEFYNANYEMCKIFYDFMQKNPDWNKFDFGLKTCIRLGSFEDSFKEFLEKQIRKKMLLKIFI
ncbi:hypothetical protein [Alkaliphilus sp. B6464]|uniref:hypothetical protein n=1 Tax=Alkaliphilus sp. B6464 TaxID=2731219 RepID=UPI001BA8D0FB|nr:hypothetical protein [Alkaliphilus sp. B6464]QUH21950.1 hypothetical protein HYG84_18765 [Alkaliphilus sp. B6464]